MPRPRVLLADDHRLVREAFAQLLEASCDVVGSVADGRALLALAPEVRPDIVVLDIAMPLLNGLDAARQLKHLMPEVRLIFLTVSEDPDLAVEAFRVGASGYLLKNSAASELLQSIQEVLQGRSYVTPLAAGGLVGSLLHEPGQAREDEKLSTRQREVKKKPDSGVPGRPHRGRRPARRAGGQGRRLCAAPCGDPGVLGVIGDKLIPLLLDGGGSGRRCGRGVRAKSSIGVGAFQPSAAPPALAPPSLPFPHRGGRVPLGLDRAP